MAEPKTNKLKTSIDIYNRLLWDDTLALDKDQIEIIHHDKYQKLKSMPFNDWTCIDQGGDIPFHKIAQFKYNGFILWDRKQRIDNINKGSGKSTIDFQTIQQSVYQTSSGNDSYDEPDNDDKATSNIINNTIVAEQDLNNYIDPMNSSEYVADSQFLNLLKMEPKSISLLYKTLNDMIDNTFVSQRPNDVEVLARKLCFKYLSFIDIMKKQNGYYLFGSAKMGLDTHKSDLDVKIIPSKANKISNRQQCIELLTVIKNEFLQLNLLEYTFKQNDNRNHDQNNNNNHIIIDMEDFKNDIDDNDVKLMELQNKIHTSNKMIDSMIIRISSIEIADGVIPRSILLFEVKLESKRSVVMEFNISMDITVSIDTIGVEQMRDKHLANWVNKYCKYNEDKRIHKFLFCVKLWAQHFKINESTSSTINGYGWIHIALFLLTNNYKQMIDNDDNNKEYESMYPDIDIPKDITTAKLFILFIVMLHKWICFDDTKESNLEKIIRPGINIISGQWIDNIKQYALFVLDPFCQSGHLPDNLAKCVRNRRGIPLMINAIKSSVQQLQFGADEAIKQNNDAIPKHIEFFNGKNRSLKSKQDKSKDADELKEQKEDDSTKDYVSWKQLQNLNLNIPKRKWVQHSSITKDDKIITICQFNCLAQELTGGHSERTTFRTDKKYLTWNYRSKRILYEILQYKPDIICLCEVDAIYFKNFYYPNLSKSSFKYDGVYLNKNNPNKHKTSSNKRSRSPKDGCAIFWNSTKFSCHDKYECILGKPKKAYHIALAVRLTYKIKNNLSSQFDVWATHLKAGRNNKAEEWRLSQVNTLLYYMKKFSNKVPILFCGDLNAHFQPLINDQGDIVDAKVYPAILNGKVKSKYNNNKNDKQGKKRDNYVLKFQSVWNNDARNTFSTWAGWSDRDVKCCLDYVMIGKWQRDDKLKNDDEDKMFKVRQILDVWDEQEVQKFDCKLPNKIYPSDHILIGAKIAIKTDSV